MITIVKRWFDPCIYHTPPLYFGMLGANLLQTAYYMGDRTDYSPLVTGIFHPHLPHELPNKPMIACIYQNMLPSWVATVCSWLHASMLWLDLFDPHTIIHVPCPSLLPTKQTKFIYIISINFNILWVLRRSDSACLCICSGFQIIG